MYKITRLSIFAGLLLASSFTCHAQDQHNDGVGDTAENPDIWVTPTDGGGAMYTPGDNQPVESHKEGNHEVIDFDTEPSAGSDIVITADPE